MRAVSVLVLVFLGAFIHCSYAIRCYSCETEYGDYCDDFDEDKKYEISCPGNNACAVARGTANCKNVFCCSDSIFVGFLFTFCCRNDYCKHS